jgi:hypothetical protein
MKSKDGSGEAVFNAEIAGEVAAFKRARRRAEAVAAATGTALVFVKDGRVVRIRPKSPLADSA